MTRLVLAIVAATALSGCQHSGQQAIDPFWGRTTVPSPATGSIGAPIVTPGCPQPLQPPVITPGTLVPSGGLQPTPQPNLLPAPMSPAPSRTGNGYAHARNAGTGGKRGSLRLWGTGHHLAAVRAIPHRVAHLPRDIPTPVCRHRAARARRRQPRPDRRRPLRIPPVCATRCGFATCRASPPDGAAPAPWSAPVAPGPTSRRRRLPAGSSPASSARATFPPADSTMTIEADRRPSRRQLGNAQRRCGHAGEPRRSDRVGPA